MANYTPNYNLYKPNKADNDIQVAASLDTNFTAIDTELNNRKNEIGTLNTLETADKTSLVKAVNEVRAGISDVKVGDLANLSTTAKDNVVNAINEQASQLAERALQTDVDDREVNVKRKYGAIGDGVQRTISSVFPNVTLTQVQALNANATLNNSADWYAIQKAVSEYIGVFIPIGNYMIDLPIIIPNRETTIRGVYKQSRIYNKGTGNAFEVNGYFLMENVYVEGTATSGSGIIIARSYCSVNNCEFSGNGRYGVEFSSTAHVTASNIRNTIIYGNKLGGVYSAEGDTSQKTAIHFDNCYVVGNGNSTDNSVALTSGGDGFLIKGSLSFTIKNTVCEYNHGSGIRIEPNAPYGIHALEVLSCYFEGNRYANCYVNNNNASYAYKGIVIKGNYYSAYPATTPYYTNSILTTSIKAIVTNKSTITESIIDDEYFGLNINGISYSSDLRPGSINNTDSSNYAKITPGTNGTRIERNVADANPALVAKISHASSNGDILQLQNSLGFLMFRFPVAGNFFNIKNSKTPSSTTDTGTAGDICWDANYVYVCVSANTWKRTALTTW